MAATTTSSPYPASSSPYHHIIIIGITAITIIKATSGNCNKKDATDASANASVNCETKRLQVIVVEVVLVVELLRLLLLLLRKPATAHSAIRR